MLPAGNCDFRRVVTLSWDVSSRSQQIGGGTLSAPRSSVTAMTTMPVTVIERGVRGRFDLAQSVTFGFGQRDASAGSTMRLAFCLDGYREQVAVAVTQPAADLLRYEVIGEADPEAAVAQAERVLSVDIDGEPYDRLLVTDPVLSRIRDVRPGLRPPLFYSAYEALLWSVLSARRPAQQMAQLRARLSRAHGRVFQVAGEEVAAIPTPRQLLAIREFPAIPEIKLHRMHAVARAALDGDLDTERLRARDPGAVSTRLQRFDGIGPFYAELVTVRALGHTDVLPNSEPRVIAATGLLVGEPNLSPAAFAELAQAWRPWRTWAAVAIRASS